MEVENETRNYVKEEKLRGKVRTGVEASSGVSFVKKDELRGKVPQLPQNEILSTKERKEGERGDNLGTTGGKAGPEKKTGEKRQGRNEPNC